MKTLNDFNFENKKALIRVDFNVPIDNQQVIVKGLEDEDIRKILD